MNNRVAQWWRSWDPEIKDILWCSVAVFVTGVIGMFLGGVLVALIDDPIKRFAVPFAILGILIVTEEYKQRRRRKRRR